MIFIGDIHRDFNTLGLILRRKENTNFIQVGDFGLGFPYNTRDTKSENLYSIFESDVEKLKVIETILKSKNNKLYVIRGNHDNPSYWDSSDYKNKMFNNVFENIILCEDFSIKEIDGNTVFFLGGSLSIDRTNRISDVTYWPTEIMNYKKIEELVPMYNAIDVVVTHIPPNGIFDDKLNPKIVDLWAKEDDKLQDDIKEELKYSKILFEKLTSENNIKYWIAGHYHISKTKVSNGIKFIALNINERYNLTEG